MRLWISLVTVLVLLLCKTSGDARVKRFGESHKDIEPCAEGNVCIIYVYDECKQNGVTSDYYNHKGFVWEFHEDGAGKGSPDCIYGNYKYVYAKLDFEPINLTNWNVWVTLADKKDSYAYTDFKLNIYGKIELNFLDDKTEMSWNKDDQLHNSENALSGSSTFESNKRFFWVIPVDDYSYKKFSFNMTAKGDKLIEVFTPSIKMPTFDIVLSLKESGVETTMTLNDENMMFLGKLHYLSYCDRSEIKEVCFGTCDKIFSDLESNVTRTSSCPSQLWYHRPSEGKWIRKWKKLNELECLMGWWREAIHTTPIHIDNTTEHEGNATTSEALPPRIDDTYEVQCSAAEPGKYTSLFVTVVAVSCCVGGLVIVVIIVVVCVLMKRKRSHGMGGDTEKKFTLRDSDSKAQTPGGKSTEREKN